MKKLNCKMPSRQQWRWFWTGFWISLIFIIFAAGFLYISYSEDSNVQEAIVSMDEKISISVFGITSELTPEQITDAKNGLSRLYRQFWIVIPPWIRAVGEGACLLWENFM